MWTLPFLLACKRVAFDLDVDLFPGGDEPAAFPEASPFELALFDERPEATVPAFLDLEELGPVLVADRLLRADDDGFLQVEVTSLALDLDAPVDLTFEVSSGTARWLVLGGEGGGEVRPARCGSRPTRSRPRWRPRSPTACATPPTPTGAQTTSP
jgi:hypothetical protein